MGRMRRAVLSVGLSVALAGLAVTGAAPASAGLTPSRTCKNFDTGDHVRRLSICARIWFNDTINQSRGVVEMHTYVLVNGHWTDVTSQSITVNFASFNGADNLGRLQFALAFGNSVSSPQVRPPAGSTVQAAASPARCRTPAGSRSTAGRSTAPPRTTPSASAGSPGATIAANPTSSIRVTTAPPTSCHSSTASPPPNQYPNASCDHGADQARWQSLWERSGPVAVHTTPGYSPQTAPACSPVTVAPGLPPLKEPDSSPAAPWAIRNR